MLRFGKYIFITLYRVQISVQQTTVNNSKTKIKHKTVSVKKSKDLSCPGAIHS